MNNNLLAEFASIQVEAIDGVLEMVARDRRRVEVLLEQVESPSLRQYLQQWLDATPAAPAVQTIVPAVTSREAESTANGEITRSREEEELCCSCGCWKNVDLSFWEIFQTRPQCAHRRFCDAIQKHHKQRSRLAFGVSYEWATETLHHSDDFPEGWSNGSWDWEDTDPYFQGRRVRHGCDQVLREEMEAQCAIRGMALSELYRSALISERNEGTMRAIFDDPPGCLPTVDQVIQAGGSLSYDIVFYGAEISELSEYYRGNRITMLRDHRTAKGTLKLEAKNGGLAGTVQLDAAMEQLDAIPCGGNFSWTETSRFERIGSDRTTSSSWIHRSTNVLFVRGKANSNDGEGPGEMRVIQQRTAAFLQSEPNVGMRNSPAALELAAQKMEAHDRDRFLWMHRHTSLPVEVIQRIGDFVSPPPVFYLEEGDLVLDMDWRAALIRIPGFDNHSSDLMSHSTIVARPRRYRR